MENPFTHNLATNIIGRILDDHRADEEKLKKDPTDMTAMSFGSLEYRIMMALFNRGLLTEAAQETVGLEGRAVWEQAKN